MGLRDILAQLMAGGGGGGQPQSFEELMALTHGDRDAAARRWNIQRGNPNSTAYSPQAAAPDPMTTGAVLTPRVTANVPIPTPAPRPDANIPIPTPRPLTNAPIGSIGGPLNAPIGSIGGPQNAPIPPPPTQFSPDLAVSPPREPDRMSAPTNAKPKKKKGKRVGQFTLEPDPARFGR